MHLETGIRQGDSLSPPLLGVIINEIIGDVKRGVGYRKANKSLKILCNTDDALLLSECEKDLQRLLYT